MIKRTTVFLFFLLFPGIAFSAQDLKGAFQESKVTGKSRTYFFQRDYDVRNTRQDIATGGMFYYTTGELKGVSLGVSFYTGQGMGLNNDNRDVYGLLAKDANDNHENFTVVGESYIKANFQNTTFKLGRQEVDIPWVNTDDNRLTPQSVNAYTLINKDIPDLEIFLSHITRMRGKASESFVSMTEYADLSAHRPLSALGLTYSGIKDLEIQLWDFYGYDFINNLYLKSSYEHEIEGLFTWHVAGQYLKQEDVGDRLGGAADTYMYALEAGFKTHGFDISLIGSAVGGNDILYPWGHDFFVSAVINDLYEAKGKGVRAVLAYDFAEIAIPGLTAKAAYADFNTPDSGAHARPDLSETDLDVRYKFHGYFDGLGIRTRYGIVNQDESLGGEDYKDTRIQLTYDFKF
jgi:hypothetical protein